MPGILDLIVEKNKIEKRLDEIDSTLHTEYNDLLVRAINAAWYRWNEELPENTYVQKYDIVDGKISIEFKPYYEHKFCGGHSVNVLLSLSSVVLKDEKIIEDEVFIAITKMHEDYKQREKLKYEEETTKKELEQLKTLQDKYKSVDLL